MSEGHPQSSIEMSDVPSSREKVITPAPIFTNGPALNESQSWSPRPTASPFSPTMTFRSFSGLPDREDQKSAFHRLHEDPLQGYPLFAHFLSQRNYGIFRQFSSLSMRHLLYLQAEILEMEEELDKLEREVVKTTEGYESRIPFSFYLLHQSGEAEGTLGYKIHQLWTSLGERLEVYHKAILRHNSLSQLPVPLHSEVEDTWNFLTDPTIHRDHGQAPDHWMAFPENTVFKFGVKGRRATDPEDPPAFNTGPEGVPNHSSKQRRKEPILKPIEEDLITINAVPNPPTRFAHDIRTHLTAYYCRLFYGKRTPNIFGGQTVQGRIFDQIVDTAVLVLSCIVPTVSIIALHFIDDQVWRLGFITLWAAGFSLCLSYFTGATHIQIFSASLGMAAVQVVFVSNGIGGSGGS